MSLMRPLESFGKIKTAFLNETALVMFYKFLRFHVVLQLNFAT